MTRWMILLVFGLISPAVAQNYLMPFEGAHYSMSVPAPTFSPPSPWDGGATTVILSDSTVGSSIAYCTTSDVQCYPTTPYTAGISFGPSGPNTICAIASASGFSPSPLTCWYGTYVGPPPAIARYTFWNPSNFCGTSGSPVACTTSGQSLYSLADLSGNGHTATLGGTLAPTYVPNAFGGRAAGNFPNSPASADYFSIPTGIFTTSQTQYTFFEVFSRTSATGLAQCSLASSLAYCLSSITGGFGQSLRNIGAGTVQGSADTTVVAINTYYATVTTWDFTSGAINYYFCAAGTCTLSSSTTAVRAALTTSTTTIGTDSVGISFRGNMVEVGWNYGVADSAWLSTFAAWVQEIYGQ